MVIVINLINSVIGGFSWDDRLLQLSDYRCPITANCQITNVQNDKKSADAPFTLRKLKWLWLNENMLEKKLENLIFKARSHFFVMQNFPAGA